MDYFRQREKAYKYLQNAVNYFFENDYKSAEEYFKKAISLNYNNVSIESFYYLSFIKDLCGDQESSDYFYNQGIYTKPIDDKAIQSPAEMGPINFYNSLSEEFCKRKNYKMAIICSEKILKIEPNNSSAYGHISLIKSNEKKYNEAIQYINKAIELYFNNHHTNNDIYYFFRGNYNAALKNFISAKDDYSKAIELNPYSSNSFKERAKVDIELKNYSEAVIDLKKSLELNPYDEESDKLLKEISNK